MIERLLDSPSVLDVVWQSTAWLTVGLIASVVVARRPARAHAALLTCIIAAVITPLAAAACRAGGWGLLEPLASATDSQRTPPSLPDNLVNQTAGFFSGLRSLGLLWLTISTLFTARLLLAMWRGRRVLREAEPIHHASMRDAATSARRAVNLSAEPVLKRSSHVTCPVIWGWSRPPQILLPVGCDPEHAARLHGVLCHEMAHARRRDHWWSLIGELVTCVLPWQPLAWLAARRLNVLSEQACDAWALNGGASPTDLAASLLAAAPEESTFALAAVSNRTGLARRIERILDARATDDPAPGRGWLAGLTAGVLALVTTAALAHRAELPAPPSVSSSLPVSAPLVVAPDLAPNLASALAVRIVPGELDLGTVPAGDAGSGEVWLVNTSETMRRVESARASCGCTTISADLPADLLPGMAMRIDITMTASRNPGERKTKFVTFNVDGQPTLKLPVHLAAAAPS